jgi:Ca-activated chloride channel family protein
VTPPPPHLYLSLPSANPARAGTFGIYRRPTTRRLNREVVIMRSRLIFVSLILLLLLPGHLWADGFIIVENPHRVPGHFPFAPMEVTYHHVSVEINDRIAVTSVDQEFRNPGSERTEGTYLFPLPAGAHIDKFSMDINGTPTEAELLTADKARSIYEDIVRKMKDPALLEYVGRDAFKVRIFPIEPHGTKHIKIKYTQVLSEDAGLVEYAYPLNTEKFSSRPIGEVSVAVKLQSDRPIKSVYCPSHDAEIKRHGDCEATIGFEAKNARPDTDFKLLFTRQKNDVDIKLLTYKRSDDDGYFMLMASPGNGVKDAKPPEKDIVFVLDTSGSMADRGKLDQAKKALNYCLANLNDGDRFNLIRFSTEAEPFFAELEHPTKQRLERASDYLDKLKPTGGTAIDDALDAALKCRQGDSDSRRRPFIIVFLTDGAPTIGVTDEDQIVKRAVDRAGDVRIFCFGIGQDVNTHLLDRVADATRAASNYVLPNEDIELKVSNFYAKVKEPVMTDLKVNFGGNVRVSQLYPSKLPDLFKGDTLLLFGRYSGDGASAAKITGTIDGKERDFAEDVKFSDSSSANDFIPRLWATRRVGWLLDEIRLHGESQELKDEVVKLAREHGIVTPYTAYLIVEDENRRNVPPISRTFRELESDSPAISAAKGAYDSTVAEAAAPAQRSGQQAVANAQAYGRMKEGWNMQQLQQGDQLQKSGAGSMSLAGGYRAAQNYAQQARVVNGKAFYQNGNTWTDAAAQNKPQKQKTVCFNSDEYFELVRNNSAAAQWLSLGSEVDVVIGDTLYSVREN